MPRPQVADFSFEAGDDSDMVKVGVKDESFVDLGNVAFYFCLDLGDQVVNNIRYG